MPEMTVAQLASACGGDVEGDGQRRIAGASTLDSAGGNDVSFVESEKSLAAAIRSKAGCLVVARSFNVAGPWSLIRADQPRLAFVKVLQVLYPEPERKPEVHASAVIAATAAFGF